MKRLKFEALEDRTTPSAAAMAGLFNDVGFLLPPADTGVSTTVASVSPTTFSLEGVAPQIHDAITLDGAKKFYFRTINFNGPLPPGTGGSDKVVIGMVAAFADNGFCATPMIMTLETGSRIYSRAELDALRSEYPDADWSKIDGEANGLIKVITPADVGFTGPVQIPWRMEVPGEPLPVTPVPLVLETPAVDVQREVFLFARLRELDADGNRQYHVRVMEAQWCGSEYFASLMNGRHVGQAEFDQLQAAHPYGWDMTETYYQTIEEDPRWIPITLGIKPPPYKDPSIIKVYAQLEETGSDGQPMYQVADWTAASASEVDFEWFYYTGTKFTQAQFDEWMLTMANEIDFTAQYQAFDATNPPPHWSQHSILRLPGVTF